jgi:carbon monoxide dehydrogenase subunit G
MAERTEGSIDVQAPPSEVMGVIADFESYPQWAQGVKSARVESRDARGRAKEVSFHVSSAGIDAKYTLTYRYLARGTGCSWATVEASGAVRDITGEYGLEPIPTGTRVTYRLSMEPAISLPGFLRRTAEKTIVNTALGGLKRRVEGR